MSAILHQALMSSYGDPTPAPTDPLWSSVLSLINGGALSDATGKTLELTGPPVVSFADSDFPDGCIEFGPTASRLQWAVKTWFSFAASEDFTIEFDYKGLSKVTGFPAIFSSYAAFGANGGIAYFDRHNSSATNYVAAINGSFPQLVTPSTFSVKRIFQISRQGSTIRLFIDGAVIATHTYSGAVTSSAAGGMVLGASADSFGTSFIHARIARWRVTKGVARNTAAYTPTTGPYPTTGP